MLLFKLVYLKPLCSYCVLSSCLAVSPYILFCQVSSKRLITSPILILRQRPSLFGTLISSSLYLTRKKVNEQVNHFAYSCGTVGTEQSCEQRNISRCKDISTGVQSYCMKKRLMEKLCKNNSKSLWDTGTQRLSLHANMFSNVNEYIPFTDSI